MGKGKKIQQFQLLSDINDYLAAYDEVHRARTKRPQLLFHEESDTNDATRFGTKPTKRQVQKGDLVKHLEKYFEVKDYPYPTAERYFLGFDTLQ